jgi:hypothetical protein
MIVLLSAHPRERFTDRPAAFDLAAAGDHSGDPSDQLKTAW